MTLWWAIMTYNISQAHVTINWGTYSFRKARCPATEAEKSADIPVRLDWWKFPGHYLARSAQTPPFLDELLHRGILALRAFEEEDAFGWNSCILRSWNRDIH
jgi:hypothetical protein